MISITVLFQHPAPLPDIPNYGVTPGWKLPPPAPSLKISKVSNGKLYECLFYTNNSYSTFKLILNITLMSHRHSAIVEYESNG